MWRTLGRFSLPIQTNFPERDFGTKSGYTSTGRAFFVNLTRPWLLPSGASFGRSTLQLRRTRFRSPLAI